MFPAFNFTINGPAAESKVRINGQWKCYPSIRTVNKNHERKVTDMKGYVTASGYMGYVDGEYILFASEEDYIEYMECV